MRLWRVVPRLSAILPADLIQIEEPESRDRPSDAMALSVGIELGAEELFLAVSIGGNAELVRGPDDRPSLLLAITGYDEWGRLTAGSRDLSDVTRIDNAAPDARGADLGSRLTCLMLEAQRKLAQLFDAPIGGAVLAVKPELGQDARFLLLQAVEGSGIDLLRIVDAADAEAEARAHRHEMSPGLAAIGGALIAEEMRRG